MDSVYLNCAASSWPRAPGVAEAVAQSLPAVPVEAGRVAWASADVAWRCRESLAALLAVDDPARIVLTSGATASLDMAIRGLGRSEGDVVVTTVAEHNSVLRPLNHPHQPSEVRAVHVGLDAGLGVDAAAFGEAMGQRPRLGVLTHASNVTGMVTEVRPLFGGARAVGAVALLDASQTPG